VSIRTKLVAALVLILTTAMGTTGAVLILEHARHDRTMLNAKQLLTVEHAAFSMQEDLSVAARELVRLSKLPEVDPADNDLDPERELLYSAHQNSVFFKELRVLDSAGRVVLVQPEGAESPNTSYADRAWFADAKKADQSFFYTVPEHGERAEAIAVIVPLRAQGRFTGAIQGILDLANDRMLSPELRHSVEPSGEFAVVDRDGRVIFPYGGQELQHSDWASAFHEVQRGRSGAMRRKGTSGEYLYAFHPVGVGTWGLVMRWPWSVLDAETDAQVRTTVYLLAAGILVAALLGIVFAAYLSRPLVTLGEIARRLARGEKGGAQASRRGDEVGALFNAFHHMESTLAVRDEKIRDDMETISRLNASLEERVKARTRELEQAQARLLEVERFAAMGKTAAAIAHELKNALNGLGMCVDLVLNDSPPTAGSRKVRAQIHREIARLRDVTESLLTFSRTPRIDPTPGDLHQTIAQALEVISEQISDGGVVVETKLAGGGEPLSATFDSYKIQGVMINLLKNAVEAMATHPLDLATAGPLVARDAAARERRLTVETRREGDRVIVEVSDTGPGVSSDARGHLYEPFFTTKVTGTGLGLATSRRVIDAHGGTIESVDRALGACFRVTLPAETAQKERQIVG
jgi:signal transduction histidine kinase